LAQRDIYVLPAGGVYIKPMPKIISIDAVAFKHHLREVLALPL
jgi:hypothetical protein